MSQHDIDLHQPKIQDELNRIHHQERREDIGYLKKFEKIYQETQGDPKRSFLYRSLKRIAAIPFIGSLLLKIYRFLLDARNRLGPYKVRVKQWPVIGPAIYWLASLLRLGKMRQELFRSLAQLGQELRNQQQQFQSLENYIRSEITGKQLIKIHQELYDQLRDRLDQIKPPQDWEQRVAQLQGRINWLEQGTIGGTATARQSTTEPQTTHDTGLLENFYWDLEEQFRGTEASVMERLEPYFPFAERLASQLPRPLRALDAGCGRGEWLTYLASQGWEICGIDSSQRMVEACQAKGLPVLHMDLLSGLSQQPDESLGLISAFHVVEHLPLDVLLKFLDLAYRKLRSGGLLLLETPNPNNLRVGANNFYIDPTHIKPIPPLLLQFMVSHRGFTNPEVLPLHPYPVDHGSNEVGSTALLLNHFLFGPQDYAIIACKS